MRLQIHKPTVNDYGGAPFAEHDMPCAVCWKESAVLNLNEGIFLPCWECQELGYQLVKKRKRFGVRK